MKKVSAVMVTQTFSVSIQGDGNSNLEEHCGRGVQQCFE
jgi:hypothetical protein